MLLWLSTGHAFVCIRLTCTCVSRQPGQNTTEEVRSRDLRHELEEKERESKEKKNREKRSFTGELETIEALKSERVLYKRWNQQQFIDQDGA